MRGKVKEARAKEVGYIRDKRVYDKIPRAQAARNKWKVVQVKLIDINRGDDENPNCRSRLVGKEFKNEPIYDVEEARKGRELAAKLRLSGTFNIRFDPNSAVCCPKTWWPGRCPPIKLCVRHSFVTPMLWAWFDWWSLPLPDLLRRMLLVRTAS